MYRQTYQILQYLVLSNHPFLGFSFLIGTSNMRYRLFILSFITAHCFSEFYRLRREAGLPAEKSYKSKRAIVDNPHTSPSKMCQMLKTSPFPRFERQGLLDISEDERYFVVNPALLEALTPSVRQSLRKKAVERLAEHFGEDERIVEVIVGEAVG